MNLSMSQITNGLKTKADKIRALAGAGYSRSDIARFLDIRYQHVRNVLVQNGQSLSSGDNGLSMAVLVAGLTTKAEKIRTLADAGYSRSDIARFLDIRYQHVRNVLVRSDQSAEKGDSGKTQAWIHVGADGRTIIPAIYRKMLSVERGGAVSIRIERGHVTLVNRSDALCRAQALVTRHLSQDTSLADELIAERKTEAQRENGT